MLCECVGAWCVSECVGGGCVSAGCECSVHSERAKQYAFARKSELFDEWFEVTNIISINLGLTFNQLCNEVPGLALETLDGNDSLMESIEVTLYGGWDEILSTYAEESEHEEGGRVLPATNIEKKPDIIILFK